MMLNTVYHIWIILISISLSSLPSQVLGLCPPHRGCHFNMHFVQNSMAQHFVADQNTYKAFAVIVRGLHVTISIWRCCYPSMVIPVIRPYYFYNGNPIHGKTVFISRQVPGYDPGPNQPKFTSVFHFVLLVSYNFHCVLLPSYNFHCVLLASHNFHCVLMPSHNFHCVLLPSRNFHCVLLASHNFHCVLLPSHYFYCVLLSPHNFHCVPLASHNIHCVLLA